MKEILLTCGRIAFVDDEDYALVNQYSWSAGISRYAERTVHEKDGTQWTQRMHTLIMDLPEGMEVDHRDRNGLNNQRHNMRAATRWQNAANMVMPQGENGSGYRGVDQLPSGRWRVKISCNMRVQHVGVFDTAEEAARAYDTAAKELHGEFAILNFPETKP